MTLEHFLQVCKSNISELTKKKSSIPSHMEKKRLLSRRRKGE